MKFKFEKLHIYFISFIAVVLPNIVFLKKVEQPKDSIFFMAFPKGELNLDFFSYYKVAFLIVSLIFLSIIFIINKRKKLKWHISYTFLLVYAVFIGLSTYFSPFRELALRGVGDRFEGMYTLLAYLLLFYVTHASIEDKEDLKVILGGVIGGSLIVGTIGVFQYFGFDFFRSDLGRSLILSKADEHMKDVLKFSFGKYTIYSTLYNTNFVGSYMIMMFFLAIGLVFKNKENSNKKYLYLSYIYSIFIFMNLIGCRSRAGFLGTQATSIFALIFFFKYIKYYKKELSILLSSFILVFFIMNGVASDYSLSDKLFNLDSGRNTIRDVYSKDGYLYFESIYGKFKLKEQNGNITFYTLDNRELEVEVHNSQISIDNEQKVVPVINFKDENIKNFNFLINSDHLIMVYDKTISLPIYFNEGKYFSTGIGNMMQELVEIPRFKLLDGREKSGSIRGYIWSRSIPLLKDTMLLGYGPDTYSIIFPQNDNFGKAMSFGQRNMVVDKPHNIYLQIGINTGVFSLINFVFACALFLIGGIFTFRKVDIKENSFSLMIYLGAIGYLVTGLFNDSLPSVAPIFWIYWAIGTYLLYCSYEKSRGSL